MSHYTLPYRTLPQTQSTRALETSAKKRGKVKLKRGTGRELVEATPEAAAPVSQAVAAEVPQRVGKAAKVAGMDDFAALLGQAPAPAPAPESKTRAKAKSRKGQVAAADLAGAFSVQSEAEAAAVAAAGPKLLTAADTTRLGAKLRQEGSGGWAVGGAAAPTPESATVPPAPPTARVSKQGSLQGDHVDIAGAKVGGTAGVAIEQSRGVYCPCMGTVHEHLGLCTACGKIICEREAGRLCSFCGATLAFASGMGRRRIEAARARADAAGQDETLHKEQAKAYRSLAGDEHDGDAGEGDAGYAEALARKQRLLEYDRTSIARSHVYDDSADYFSDTTSIWLSSAEQNAAAKQEVARQEHLQSRRSGRGVTLNISVTGGAVAIQDAQAAASAEDLASAYGVDTQTASRSRLAGAGGVAAVGSAAGLARLGVAVGKHSDRAAVAAAAFPALQPAIAEETIEDPGGAFSNHTLSGRAADVYAAIQADTHKRVSAAAAAARGVGPTPTQTTQHDDDPTPPTLGVFGKSTALQHSDPLDTRPKQHSRTAANATGSGNGAVAAPGSSRASAAQSRAVSSAARLSGAYLLKGASGMVPIGAGDVGDSLRCLSRVANATGGADFWTHPGSAERQLAAQHGHVPPPLRAAEVSVASNIWASLRGGQCGAASAALDSAGVLLPSIDLCAGSSCLPSRAVLDEVERVRGRLARASSLPEQCSVTPFQLHGVKVNLGAQFHADTATAAATLASWCDSPSLGPRSSLRVLRDGMVLVKGGLPLPVQAAVLHVVRLMGLGLAWPEDAQSMEAAACGRVGGFYTPRFASGESMHASMLCMGQQWNPKQARYTRTRSNEDNAVVPPLPALLARVAQCCLANAATQDGGACAGDWGVEAYNPQIALANYYSAAGRMGLHQDKDEDAACLRAGSPVVSISCGASADFLYCEEHPDSERAAGHGRKQASVKLESGDVLVFGGASRMLFHGIGKVYAGTEPKTLPLAAGRLNLTFRQLREAAFQY